MAINSTINNLFGDFVGQVPIECDEIADAPGSLAALGEFLDERGLLYYTVFGTLLGCVRQQGLFSYDNDVDIAMHEADLALLADCMRELCQRGFKVVELGWSVIKLRSLPGDIHIDIWVIEPVSAVLFKLLGWRWRLDHAVFSRDYFNRSQRCELACHDFSVCVPDQAELLVPEWYGDQWRVPMKNAFAEYRPMLSRIFSSLFITSVVPFRFSHNPKSCYPRAWVRFMVRLFKPDSVWTRVPDYVVD